MGSLCSNVTGLSEAQRLVSAYILYFLTVYYILPPSSVVADWFHLEVPGCYWYVVFAFQTFRPQILLFCHSAMKINQHLFYLYMV